MSTATVSGGREKTAQRGASSQGGSSAGTGGSTIELPELSLPNAGGSLGYGETFTPNGFTGTAELTFPLPMPEARGLKPSIALSYSSGAGNGVFGMGFTLTPSSFTRSTFTGPPAYDDTDTLIFDNDYLVPKYAQSGNAWQRVERRETLQGQTFLVRTYLRRVEGPNDVIELWSEEATGTSHWKVTDADGGVRIFGQSPRARVFDPSDPKRIFRWLLCEEIDLKGNRIVYTYKAEDSAGLPAGSPPASTAQRYLDRVWYGNPTPDAAVADFCHMVILDYGSRDLDPPTIDPVRAWSLRPDPSSSYRAGFEIRTNRRCQAVLIACNFPQTLAGSPLVTDVLSFDYCDEADRDAGLLGAVPSRMISLRHTGWRHNAAGTAQSKAMPKVRFDYTGISPDTAAFGPISSDNGRPLSGNLADGSLQMVDLYGDGLTGFLTSGGPDVIYWRPLGKGRYQPGQPPPEFPNARTLSPRRVVLNDVEGNGRSDLMVITPGMTGFFPNRLQQDWGPFQPLPAVPTVLLDPKARLLDLNGSGRTDVLCGDGSGWQVAMSKGADGYNAPHRVETPEALPFYSSDAEYLFAGFANIFGDGLAHIVHVWNGGVRVWPSLGNGTFAAPITLPGAPSGLKNASADQIQFADVTGNGCADLIIAHADGINIAFNEFGNGFSAPRRFALPDGFTRIDGISAGDILGLGLSGLVVDQNRPAPRQQFLSLASHAKPYMLCSYANGMGAETELAYRPASDFALADRAAGAPWVTALEQNPQVLVEVIVNDPISQSARTTVYQYRDAYYDPISRAFRGFAYVQSQDHPVLASRDWHFSSRSRSRRLIAAQVGASEAAPLQTRQWSHTGAFETADRIAEDLAGKAYHDGYPLPPPTLPGAIYAAGADAVRQAHVALVGRPYREEKRGLDGDGDALTTPYDASQSTYALDMLQPPLFGNYAVFRVNQSESLESTFEADPDAQPRLAHVLNVTTDRFGQPLQSLKVFYANRQKTGADPLLPGQDAAQIDLDCAAFINVIEGQYENTSGTTSAPVTGTTAGAGHLVGLAFERQMFQITGFVEPGALLSFSQAQSLASEAMQNVVPYGANPVAGTVQAIPQSWQQDLYVNAALDDALPLQQVAPVPLEHHQQVAVFPQSLVDRVFGTKVDDTLMETIAGYRKQDGYWWNWRDVARYLDADGFYLLSVTTDPFGHEVSVTYDETCLFQIKRTDQMGFTAHITWDVQSSQPARIVDVNDNTAEALFDPLGQVMVTCQYGEEGGKKVGDDPLADYTPLPVPTTTELLADPAKYLQNAGSYALENLQWDPATSMPPHTVMVRRRLFANPETGAPSPSATNAAYDVSIGYFDASQRALGTASLVSGTPPLALHPPQMPKLRMANAQEANWLVSDRVRFDSRGKVGIRYLPYLTDTPGFVLQPVQPHDTLKYDPLGREIGTLTAKGFLTRNVHAIWQTDQYDADDTVTQSPYYKANISNPTLPEPERAALEQAAVFEDTPLTSMLDVRGRTIASRSLLVDHSGAQPEPLTALRWLDPQERELATSNPRFFNAADPARPSYFDALSIYDMGGTAISRADADAGNVPLPPGATGTPRLTLTDALGNPVEVWTPRGYRISTRYDPGRRPLTQGVIGNGLSLTFARFVYGSAPSANTVNRVIESYDQASIQVIDRYSLSGDPFSHARQYVADWTQPADWTTPSTVALDPTVWTTTFTYDGDGNTIGALAPDGTRIAYALYPNGWLKAIALTLPGSTNVQMVAGPMLYAANGRVSKMPLGNGALVERGFEPTTLRLTSIHTTTAAQEVVQDLSYAYDPVGNVTSQMNALPVPGDASATSGDSAYVFDSLYRLMTATGRAAKGLGQNASHTPPALPASSIELERYEQRFTYDHATNLTAIAYAAAASSWQQDIAISLSSNHGVLRGMITGTGTPDDFYDAGGNLLSPTSDLTLDYDFFGNAAHTERVDGTKKTDTWGQFSNGRERLRKVAVAPDGTTVETLYLDDAIITRPIANGAPGPVSEISVQVMLNERLALQLRTPAGTGSTIAQYQLEDHLTSVAARLDQAGTLVDVQEYLPYGSDALWVSASGATSQTQAKRYRFAQKEVDLGSGLYRMGQRAYIPWMGRWTSPDPAGPADGPNLFAYVGGNPITKHDPDGLCGKTPNFWDSVKQKANFYANKTKYQAKEMNAWGVMLNAMLDTRFVALEMSHKLKLPLVTTMGDSTKSLLPTARSIGHFGLLGSLQMVTRYGGMAGIAYHSLAITQEGFKEKHVLGIVGNSLFTAEGYMLLKAMGAASTHTLHHSLHMAGRLGFAADSVKAVSYYRQGDYSTALMYGLLAGGNGLSLASTEQRMQIARFLFGNMGEQFYKANNFAGEFGWNAKGFSRTLAMTSARNWLGAGLVASVFVYQDYIKKRVIPNDLD
ncbi:SpvB/TcaC N-terminal domain-containing protein [Breoghania sp.]|uniref:SpvB/TcaC N-terminal domain-containing protein n=1 Tax=Breoghania sp. TaxID=2065378 RepID=UPI002AAAEBB6|nr:SpvB/TcaC N-terminal domain-containing protein [Breoghania sp.]